MRGLALTWLKCIQLIIVHEHCQKAALIQLNCLGMSGHSNRSYA